MASSTSIQYETDDLEVTGVSRSGRVRKKSSKLMYFHFANSINHKKKNKVSKRQQLTKQSKNIENDVTQNLCQVTNENSDLNSQKRSKNQQKRASIKYQSNKKKMKTDSSSEVSLLTNSETESDSNQSNNELKTPDYTSYDEESLNSDQELLNSKVKLPIPEPKKFFSPGVLVDSRPTLGQNSIYTGYKLWSSEMKKEILKKYPNIDISIMTVRLGEMWTKLSVNDRNIWHYRAQHLTENEYLQNKSVLDNDKKDWLNSCNRNGAEYHQMNYSCNEIRLRTIDLQPIDVAAHIKLLGESLILIGARLKRHDKPVIISDCITVLLDSLLCAMGSLICLIQQIPITKLDNSYTFLRILENVAYIMPGL